MKPPNQRHTRANNVKVDTNKTLETGAKFTPTDDGPRLTTDEYNQLMAMIQKSNDGNSQHFANTTSILSQTAPVASYSKLCWIIDSGAMDHVTSSVELLNPKSLPRITTISTPDGGQTHIESTGSLHITPHIKLDGVLKVPQFRVNLLSVSKLTQALKCTMTFFSDFCVVQDAATRKTIGLGKQQWPLLPSTRSKSSLGLRHSQKILIFGINVLGIHHPVLFKLLQNSILQFILILNMSVKFVL